MSSQLYIPDPQKLATVEGLCAIVNPYEDFNLLDDMFLKAIREIVNWHQQYSPFYAKLIESEKFNFRELASIDDLFRVPYILANFFKRHEILSIPKESVYLHLTSSGTTGQKSQIFFDEWSIKSAQRMVDWIFAYYGWDTPQTPCNYLLYSYAPSAAHALGTSYTDNYLCKYAPVKRAHYALREWRPGDFKFDLWGCVDALLAYSREVAPVRIFGFPAFLYYTLVYLKEKNIHLQLDSQSLVFLGGGWKGHQSEAIDKNEFYQMVEEYLGIPNERIRDGFGSVEHCIPYVECSQHHFHVPIWSRVIIRDVKTMGPKKWGEVGYLNFIAPYITSVPAHSVVMGDLAALYPGTECPCGLNTPYFEIVGRAGTSKSRSCAVAASELLKEFH